MTRDHDNRIRQETHGDVATRAGGVGEPVAAEAVVRVDPFAIVLPGPRGPARTRVLAPAPTPGGTDNGRLTNAQVLAWTRQLLPDLAQRAALEAQRASQSQSLGRRPASWAFAALLQRASGLKHDEAGIDQWFESTDEACWQELGFPRVPGHAEVRRYLTAAQNGPQLKVSPARALVAVLPDVARSGKLPGEHITVDGRRRRLNVKGPRRARGRRP